MSVSKTMASAGGGGGAERSVPVGVASAAVEPGGSGAGAGGVPEGAGARGGHRRRRLREVLALDEAARGAPPETLARPAGEVLDAMPWAGVAPDPDVLDAVTFLAWL